MHLRQVLVDTPCDVHQHRTRHSAIRRANEARRRQLAIEMRHKSQEVGLSDLGPRRLALEDYIPKRDVLRAGRGRLGRRVVPLDRPLGQLTLKEVHKVLLHLHRAIRARHARYQDWGEQRAIVDVKVGAGPRNSAQEAVGEWLVGCCGEEEEEQGQHRGKPAHPRRSVHIAGGC